MINLKAGKVKVLGLVVCYSPSTPAPTRWFLFKRFKNDTFKLKGKEDLPDWGGRNSSKP